ncbi:DUF5059 domain-containing protein [Natrinema ejinorense]|uniref:Cytochrome Fbr n=1 Tax=Natrinema ejinorense TaxID=373386 RepID=A0A2A5QUA6_9EURY|nr:DUF5059 domain-containing protein [Natrinema ejinorense]PCR90363.1 cytochrome Fbr [Natrinema ejinorense]
MQQTRRAWLKGGGAALVSLGLAGCSETTDGEDAEPDSTEGEGTPESPDEESTITEPIETAVAAEWNAMRARLWDALAVGRAGETEAGAAVAEHTFSRFETATGEYNAHELLEETDESRYEEFEEALGELRTEGLERGDIGRTREEAVIGDEQLREAQRALVGESASRAFDLQTLGTTVADTVVLASAGAFDAAETVATDALGRFEEAAVHDAIEETDGDVYERFESAIESVVTAAETEDAAGVRSSASDALAATVDGGYALASAETAGSGQLATYQARGWDAAALASVGGPSTAFAHAAALTVYRARAHDAAWLFDRGHPDAAARIAENVFAHFEGARAHEALEEASEDAYHRFEEDGLDALATAIENDDAAGVTSAVETIDDGLVTGIDALGTGVEPALLEAGFFKARIEDALERYRLGENEVAAETARGLFERFESNEADFHETLEETDESLYETFEDEHLNGIIEAFESGDDAAVDDHATGIRERLLEFETTAGTTAQVSAVESGYMAARVFDAGVLDVLGESDRAEAVVRDAFEHFESGAGGFHEALEDADHDRYESFERALGDARGAAENDGSVPEAARTFDEQALEATYTVVASAGGSYGEAAASIMRDAFADFEEARVHELLEDADREAYEGFEAALEDYIAALESGSGVDGAAETFATATLRAQFAVAGAPDAAPGDDGTTDSDGEADDEPDLEGGPNVVEGVPDDADHVVDMQAVAFEPAELTVEQGETVAWTHASGEPHSVSAYEDGIPSDATYWASGGFESETDAREGWENGQGAVTSGESYVHTFETTGKHEYVCIPHEAAGMVGTIVVE